MSTNKKCRALQAQHSGSNLKGKNLLEPKPRGNVGKFPPKRQNSNKNNTTSWEVSPIPTKTVVEFVKVYFGGAPS